MYTWCYSIIFVISVDSAVPLRMFVDHGASASTWYDILTKMLFACYYRRHLAPRQNKDNEPAEFDVMNPDANGDQGKGNVFDSV